MLTQLFKKNDVAKSKEELQKLKQRQTKALPLCFKQWVTTKDFLGDSVWCLKALNHPAKWMQLIRNWFQLCLDKQRRPRFGPQGPQPSSKFTLSQVESDTKGYQLY